VEKAAPGIIPLEQNQYRTRVGDSVHSVKLLDENTVEVDGKSYSSSIVRTPQGTYSLLLDNSIFEIVVLESALGGEDNSLQLRVGGRLLKVTIEDHRSLVRKGLLGAHPSPSAVQEIRAPMPGKVVRIEVRLGETVIAGRGLLVLEAMKMENEIRSTTGGIVEKIFIEPGRAVEKGEILLSLKAN
jgi:pyruvate carboxylase subunit B